MALCNMRSSSSFKGVRRPGSNPARHRISSANKLPMPATRSWSISRALSGAEGADRAGSSPAQPAIRPGADERVRTEAGLVRGELERTETPGVMEQEVATVGEREAGPDPLVIEYPWPVEQAVQRFHPVDHQTACHAEANTEGRAVIGIEEQELAPAPRLREGVADQGTPQPAGGRASPPVAGIHHPDVVDRAVEALLGQAAV